MNSKITLIACVLGALVFLNFENLKDVYLDWADGDAAVPEPRGTYVKRAGGLALEFLGSGEVNMLLDGSRLGEGPATYEIDGRTLRIIHACGVWNMRIRDADTLFHPGQRDLYLRSR